jgi:hypothetical protein
MREGGSEAFWDGSSCLSRVKVLWEFLLKRQKHSLADTCYSKISAYAPSPAHDSHQESTAVQSS